MEPSDGMTINELTIYTSPRYFRLIFPKIKPRTKNGDLVSALGELIRWNFLTLRSHWDHISLTEKGKIYKNIIQEFLDLGVLNVPQGNGLLDYRSEVGRKTIILLIRFLASKFDFKKYINYLHIPIFESDQNPEWMSLFGREDSPKIDYNSPEGRDQLVNYLKNRNRPYRRETKAILETMTTHDTPVLLNQGLIKKFLQKNGMNRPTPLFHHLNGAIPAVFQIHDRKFYVNLSTLTKLSGLLENHITDYPKREL